MESFKTIFYNKKVNLKQLKLWFNCIIIKEFLPLMLSLQCIKGEKIEKLFILNMKSSYAIMNLLWDPLKAQSKRKLNVLL